MPGIYFFNEIKNTGSTGVFHKLAALLRLLLC